MLLACAIWRETMVRLTTRHREILGEKLLDLANLAVTALVFGQFVGQRPPSVALVATGVLLWIVFAIMAFGVARDRRW